MFSLGLGRMPSEHDCFYMFQPFKMVFEAECFLGNVYIDIFNFTSQANNINNH